MVVGEPLDSATFVARIEGRCVCADSGWRERRESRVASPADARASRRRRLLVFVDDSSSWFPSLLRRLLRQTWEKRDGNGGGTSRPRPRDARRCPPTFGGGVDRFGATLDALCSVGDGAPRSWTASAASSRSNGWETDDFFSRGSAPRVHGQNPRPQSMATAHRHGAVPGRGTRCCAPIDRARAAARARGALPIALGAVTRRRRPARYATGTTSTATAIVWSPPPRMTPFTGLTSP